MAETQGGSIKTGGRSPGYPFIALAKALDRASELKEAEGFYTVPLTSAYKAWGISEKSSSSPQIVAALKHFGLLEYEGTGAQRSVKLTDMARRIILDVRPNSADKQHLIKQAALTPPIHRELLNEYPDGFPSDATMQTFLVLEKGFNENGAKSLISEVRETFAFAKIGKSDNIPNIDGDDPAKEEHAESADVVGDNEMASGHHGMAHTPEIQKPVPLSAGERVLTTGLLAKGSSFKLVVTGPVGPKEIERLIRKLELDKEILADPENGEPDAG